MRPKKEHENLPTLRGITYETRASGFRLRWYERHETPDGVRRVRQSWTVETKREAHRVAHEIHDALEHQGYWEPPKTPTRPMPMNLEALSVEWLDTVGGIRGHRPATRSNLKHALKRFFTALRKVKGLSSKQAIPTSMLTTETVEAVCVHLNKKGLAPGTVYQTMHPVICEFWAWATDRGVPTLVPAPRDTKNLLPRNPLYGPPAMSPRFAEIDEMLRRVEDKRALTAGVLMRATGLRIEQTSYIEGRHFDEAENTLVVTKGKSRHEQSIMRTVPVPVWLIPLLNELGVWQRGHLFEQRGRGREPVGGRMLSPRNLSSHLRAAWRKAAAERVVRDDVWVPKNRKKASTTHCMRAAYQAHLMDNGVQEFVIDYLVGHRPRNTRGVSYAKPSMNLLRKAVALLPALELEPTKPEPKADASYPEVGSESSRTA